MPKQKSIVPHIILDRATKHRDWDQLRAELETELSKTTERASVLTESLNTLQELEKNGVPFPFPSAPSTHN